MKPILFCFLFISFISFSQNEYSVSDTHPYGLPNPKAPEQVKDFQPLIGKCNCESTLRNPDGTWAKTQTITWEWKYIMNGMAVQDETIKPDGKHSGSIRQFIADSSKWYVHYYSTNFPTPTLPAWEGNKVSKDSIVLYRPQKAPNGMDGKYRISFYNMSDKGYDWIGEWVDLTEKVVYPTWKISCKRDLNETSDLEAIKQNISAFSKAYMDGDITGLVDMYTINGKIFPNNRKILAGKEALAAYWTLAEGVKILHHKVIPTDIIIEGETAYDYGYYEGKTLTKDGNEVTWQGKYVIIWKKVNNQWKIELDIWNNVAE
jgi:ketosteroid isomerase-like protein